MFKFDLKNLKMAQVLQYEGFEIMDTSSKNCEQDIISIFYACPYYVIDFHVQYCIPVYCNILLVILNLLEGFNNPYLLFN